VKGILARALIERVRRWDLANSAHVTEFAAISQYIGDRIRRAYGRASTVVYPPVDTTYFTPAGARGAAYVTASRFVPYKRIELIVRAFAQLPDRELLVIGDGPERAAIARAAGPNVRLLGWQSRAQLRDHLRAARAFLFAAEEDFGIAPLDAQACGTPVIAFGQGGVAETVRGTDQPSPTGVFFHEATEQGIVRAVRELEALAPGIAPEACRENAERFSAERFRASLRAFVETATAAAARRTP
jgi:glycosyltransferase involved in cell wall biosynthesis